MGVEPGLVNIGVVPDLYLVSFRDTDVYAIVDDIFDGIERIQLHFYVLEGAVFVVAGYWCHLCGKREATLVSREKGVQCITFRGGMQ